ncbi:protein TBATA isoform X3 [Dromaius novaehollandiae]|uniref:protein TBATA isoform X3 n=1 Tax=Dromaius novaehollandiae TaxID=8790 RepID=UPI00311F137C
MHMCHEPGRSSWGTGVSAAGTAGLNGVPVCTAKDGWPALSPLSPQSRIKDRLSTPIPGGPGRQMPIGDPPSKAIPWLTAGVLSEAWREEPRELAARVDAASPAETAKEEVASHEKAQRVTQYPAEMGQLIPPPSRATARRSSRQLYRGSARTEGKQAALSCQDRELVVLEPPGQILQAHSSTAAQQRLLTAGQREKDVVLGLLQAASATLQLQPQALGTGTGDSARSQASQATAGLSSRDRRGGRNQPGRCSQGQKQEPVPQEEKAARTGTAEVLQVHSSREEKPRQPDPTN